MVYFLTIIGNTLGGILTGFVLLPYFGTEHSVALFGTIGIAFGAGVRELGGTTLSTSFCATTTAMLLTGALLLFPRKGELYEVMHASAGKDLDFVFAEGVDGTVVTYHRNERVRNFINGVAHGGPTNLLKSDGLKEIVVVEINNTLLRNFRKIPFFAMMLNDPRVHLTVDDGRRYLFNTIKKFDLITTDALWSFTAYSNNLYSQDFYRLVQAHLGPRGVYMAWHDEQHVIPKTLASVFSHVQMFRSFSIASNAVIAAPATGG